MATQYQQIRMIAKALCLTATDKTDLVREAGRDRWWIVGCVEGDQPLPQTGGRHTVDDAIDCALGWLASKEVTP